MNWRCISVFYLSASFYLFLLVGLLVVIMRHLPSLLRDIMADRDNRLRQERIARHASFQREKRQVLEAHFPSSPLM